MKVGDIIKWKNGFGNECFGEVIACSDTEYNEFVVENITPLEGTTSTWDTSDKTPYEVVGNVDEA